MMNRLDLIDKLNLVAPALSDTNLVPVLSHFWFLGDQLQAYNDQIAISTKLVTEFVGAVPGATLLSLLVASRAKDVELLTKQDDKGKKLPDGQLVIKAASSRLKLPFLPEASMKLFEMPEPRLESQVAIDMTSFLEGIESCLRSVKEDTSIPDSLGITLIFNDKTLDLYATNDATISYAQVKLQGKQEQRRVVLSGNFCRQMVALVKEGKKKHLEINDDYALFQCGDNTLFGTLVEVVKPLDFESVLDSSFPVGMKQYLVAIPSKLQLILERSIIITESKTERPRMEIAVQDGRALFYSQSDKGEVRDTMLLEQSHPDVFVTIEPKLLKAGFGHFSKFLLTETCAVMVKDNSIYLVSASS